MAINNLWIGILPRLVDDFARCKAGDPTLHSDDDDGVDESGNIVKLLTLIPGIFRSVSRTKRP